MGIFDKFKQITQQGREEIDKAVSDKLMEEEMNPTLRKHHGEPIRKPKGDKK